MGADQMPKKNEVAPQLSDQDAIQQIFMIEQYRRPSDEKDEIRAEQLKQIRALRRAKQYRRLMLPQTEK